MAMVKNVKMYEKTGNIANRLLNPLISLTILSAVSNNMKGFEGKGIILYLGFSTVYFIAYLICLYSLCRHRYTKSRLADLFAEEKVNYKKNMKDITDTQFFAVFVAFNIMNCLLFHWWIPFALLLTFLSYILPRHAIGKKTSSL